MENSIVHLSAGGGVMIKCIFNNSVHHLREQSVCGTKTGKLKQEHFVINC